MTACSSPPLEIVQATRTRVVGRDARGVPHTYVLSPTGWRQGDPTRRDPGQLVVDPWLIALLDGAAIRAD